MESYLRMNINIIDIQAFIDLFLNSQLFQTYNYFLIKICVSTESSSR